MRDVESRIYKAPNQMLKWGSFHRSVVELIPRIQLDGRRKANSLC